MKKHPQQEILLAGLAGTLAMSACSYALTAMTGKNYKEPSLLGKILRAFIPAIDQKQEVPYGWLAHIGVGIGFAELYATMMEKGMLDSTPAARLGVGVGTGVVAVAAWEMMLRTSLKEKHTDKHGFHLQLIPAHIVFAWVTMGMLGRHGHGRGVTRHTT